MRISLFASTKHTSIINNSGEVSSWGTSSFPGDGYWEINRDTTRKILTGISQVSSGKYGGLYLTASGKLYGYGAFPELSVLVPPLEVRNTQAGPLYEIVPGDIKQAQLGYQLAGYLTFDGDLYLWGPDYRGTLRDILLDYSESPKLVASNVLAFNLSHTDNLFYIDKFGRVFVIGQCAYGSTSPGEYQFITRPKQIFLSEAGDPVIQIAGGREHTIFRTASGDVYTYGRNNYRQSDPGNSSQVTETPVKVLEHAIDINVGPYHNVVIDTFQDLYAWGSNVLSETDPTSSSEWINDIISPLLSGVNKVAAKGHMTIAVLTSGEVVGIGANALGTVFPAEELEEEWKDMTTSILPSGIVSAHDQIPSVNPEDFEDISELFSSNILKGYIKLPDNMSSALLGGNIGNSPLPTLGGGIAKKRNSTRTLRGSTFSDSPIKYSYKVLAGAVALPGGHPLGPLLDASQYQLEEVIRRYAYYIPPQSMVQMLDQVLAPFYNYRIELK